MAVNPFPGKSEVWLETELDKVLAEQSSGKTLVSAQDGDVSGAHAVQSSIRQRKYDILVALTILNPTDYPPATTLPKRVTVGRFQDWL